MFVPVVLVASLALVAAGCGGGNKPSTTSATVEWANGFCTAITSWTDALKTAGDALGTSPSKEGLEQAADDVRTATEKLVDDLRALGAPETESGEETRQAIDELATTLEGDLSEIEDAAAGVSGLIDLPGAITTIGSALSSMGTAFSSTIQTIEDADAKGELEDAFDQADACGEITGSSE